MLTSLCFLDETGLLNRKEDRFFALGILKTSVPEALYYPLQSLRDRHCFYDEIKWKNVSAKNSPLLTQVVEIFLNDKNSSFAAIILDKNRLDFEKYFANNFWQVYESFTTLLLRGNIRRNEQVVLLADYYPSPLKIQFEQNVKNRINNYLKRDALLIGCRLNSKGVDLLQVTDLLLGAIVYDLKLKHRLIPFPSKLNKSFLFFLKEKTVIPSFAENLRTNKFNILHFKDSLSL